MPDNLTTEQMEKLLKFTKKHTIQQLLLEKDECERYFRGIKKAEKIENGRLILSPGLAEGSRTIESSWSKSIERVFIPQQMLFSLSEEEKAMFPYPLYTLFEEKILERFLERLGFELLLQKIAEELNKMYSISVGQASAVLRKALGFKLNSGQRSFIHDLRLKIRRYKALVDNFEEYILKKAKHQQIPASFKEELTGEAELQDIKKVDKIEKRWSFANKLILKCIECNYTEDMPREILESDDFVPLPKHHQSPMMISMLDEKLLDY